MTTPAFRGIWGFKIVPNETVGGGLFSTARLENDESVLESVLAIRQGPGWFNTSGYLTPTDRRVIFTPYRWLLLGRARSLRYAEIQKVEASRVHNPGVPSSFLADSIVIHATAGRREVFFPAAAAEPLARRIREALPP